MHMKKHLIRLLLSLLFLVGTAMSCDEEPAIPTDIPCILKDVELYHWDNAGELPKEPAENKIPKEAYILEIRLLTEVVEDGVESYYDNHFTQHILSDAIKKIQIFTETAFNDKFPRGAEVTSCFYDYPKIIDNYQQTDYTVDGGSIWRVDKTNRIYKALIIIPQPGEYHFRVVLTKESGETIERVSEPISLY